jgi:hypothetical protein
MLGTYKSPFHSWKYRSIKREQKRIEYTNNNSIYILCTIFYIFYMLLYFILLYTTIKPYAMQLTDFRQLN